MVSFVTTGAIAGNIEDIIKNAKQELVLITPYLSIHEMVLQRLQYAARLGVPITLIYRKNATRTKADEADLAKLKALETLALYAIDNLHAKCFMNEAKVILTSMNLHQYSESHNREMGIVATKLSERQIYKEVYEEYESIKAAAEPVNDLAKKERSTKKSVAAKPIYKPKEKVVAEGFCIRCAAPRTFSLFAPLCNSCYNEWAQWKNYDYTEKFCHMCSAPSETSMNKPLCYNCWTENKNLLPHITHYHQYKM